MIKSSFYSFETAKRAIMNSQLGLDVTGNNISNVNTGGYTRQRIDQVSFGTSGFRSKIKLYGASLPGHGSAVTGISQIRDPFLDNRYRAEYANIGDMSVKSDILAELSSIFDEIKKDGLHFQLDELIEALNIDIAKSTSKEISAVVRNVARQFSQVLNANSTQLDTSLTQYYNEFVATVDSVNSLLKQIADINTVIREEDFYGNSALELRDQRNMMIDELSQYIDIQVDYRNVKLTEGVYVEECNIYLKGVSATDGELLYLVQGSKTNEFAVEPAGVDATSRLLNFEELTLTLVDSVSKLEIRGNQGDMNKFFYNGMLSGQLSGFVNAINGTGSYDNISSDFRGIQYYRRTLDDLAITFGTLLNQLNTPDYSLRINDRVDRIADAQKQIDQITADLADPTKNFTDEQIDSYRGKIIELQGDINGYLEDLSGMVEIRYTDSGGNPATYLPVPQTSPPTAAPVYPTDFDSPLHIYIEDPTGTTQIDLITGGVRNPDLVISNQVLDKDGNVLGLLISDTGTGLDIDIIADMLTPPTPPATEATLHHNLIAKPLFQWDPAHPARSFAVTQNWLDDEEWFTVTMGYGIAGEENSGFASNAARIKDAIENGPGGDWGIDFENPFKGSFQEFVVNIMSEIGMDQKVNNTMLDSSIKVWTSLATQRDSVSAVNADEEAINMMIFQNYYNAAARYMTTLDEALGTVIQSMGVVGR